jgi:ArsR family transcriptional regulator
MAVEKLAGKTKIVATKVLSSPQGAAPCYRIAEVYFPSMQALDACAGSKGSKPSHSTSQRKVHRVPAGGENHFGFITAWAVALGFVALEQAANFGDALRPENLRYHSSMDRRTFLRITKALVDARRFEILERIAAVKDEISCRDLRVKLPISRATLSHHLKELATAATAGLIDIRRQSRYMYLRLRRRTWSEYLVRLHKVGS